MKTYEQIMKQHGYTPGLFNDPWSHKFVSREYEPEVEKVNKKEIVKKYKSSKKKVSR